MKTETNTAMMIANAAEEMGLSAKDVTIPFIALAQNTGKAVEEGIAKQGDIYSTQENVILGGYDKPIDIIPIKAYKLWREFEVTEGGQKFVTQYPIVTANETQPWEFVSQDGKRMRRYYTYNVVVLLKSDCDKGEPRPYIVSFYSKSQYAGKKITSHFYNRLQLMKSHMSHVFSLSSHKKKNTTGSGSYAVYDVTKGIENPFMDMAVQCYSSLPSNSQAAEKFKQAEQDVIKDAEVIKDDFEV